MAIEKGGTTFDGMYVDVDGLAGNYQNGILTYGREGKNCYNGGLYKYVLNNDKNRLKEFNISTESIQNWEDCPQTVKKINAYAKILAELE